MPSREPTLDLAFRTLFADSQHVHLLVSFLDAVLEPNEPIVGVEWLVRPRTATFDGNVAVSLRLRLGSGVRLRVELERARPPWRPERALRRWAELYAAEFDRFAASAVPDPVVGIHVVDFPVTDGVEVHEVFSVISASRECLSTDLEIHLLDLSKLAVGAALESDPGVLRWARLLAAKDSQELALLAASYPEFEAAVNLLTQFHSWNADASKPRGNDAEGPGWNRVNAQVATGHGPRSEGPRVPATFEPIERQTAWDEGRRSAWVSTIEQLCASLGIELDPARRQALARSELEELSSLIRHLFEARSWPEE